MACGASATSMSEPMPWPLNAFAVVTGAKGEPVVALKASDHDHAVLRVIEAGVLADVARNRIVVAVLDVLRLVPLPAP